VEVHISLVGRKDLTGEIYRQLRRAILDGRLPPGGRLPPTRELARRLSVSRTTVTVAYDRLLGEGFLATRVGAGTFVGNGLGAAARPTRRSGGALRPRPVWDGISVPVVFEQRAEFDFRPGIPDARLFPYQTWRRLLARELRPDAVGSGGYADPAGHQDLREAITRHLGVARGVQATAEDVVVTNGTQQAIDLSRGCCWRRATGWRSRTPATGRRGGCWPRWAPGSPGCRSTTRGWWWTRSRRAPGWCT
jgi:GntR family transcriptional regulator/MocR family aminotransferase